VNETVKLMSGIKEVGTVIGYRRSGYGWLDWNGVRLWIHIQDVRNADGHMASELKVGQRIKFEVVENAKGKRAVNARVIETTTASTIEVKADVRANQ
jgi:cold shock CspA family protein